MDAVGRCDERPEALAGARGKVSRPGRAVICASTQKSLPLGALRVGIATLNSVRSDRSRRHHSHSRPPLDDHPPSPSRRTSLRPFEMAKTVAPPPGASLADLVPPQVMDILGKLLTGAVDLAAFFRAQDAATFAMAAAACAAAYFALVALFSRRVPRVSVALTAAEREGIPK